jgi:mRNA degradation ribonuclease J1/J2
MIYKLRYTDKEAALIDLKSKFVIDNDLNFINGTEAVVECGIIFLTNGTYDEEGAEVTAPIFAEGYHYDLMSSDEIVFENEIIVNNPRFTFAGY